MIEVKGTLKKETLLFSAIIMSVAVHCIFASLFFVCFKARSISPYIPAIISVDIRSLEPVTERKPHINQPHQVKPDKKLHSVPRDRILPLQAQSKKAILVEERELSPSRSITISTGKPQVSAPLQERKDSPFSPPVETNTSNMTSTDKSAPSQREETVDIHARKSYLEDLKEIIERHKEYPLMARKGRMEGTVRICCKLTRSGELKESMIAGSSGHEILDKAALRAVRAAGRFPSVPIEIKGDSFCFVAPITFRLSTD